MAAPSSRLLHSADPLPKLNSLRHHPPPAASTMLRSNTMISRPAQPPPLQTTFDEDHSIFLGYHSSLPVQFAGRRTHFPTHGKPIPNRATPTNRPREAYMADGDKPQSIANYLKSLALTRRTGNAVQDASDLNAPDTILRGQWPGCTGFDRLALLG